MASIQDPPPQEEMPQRFALSDGYLASMATRNEPWAANPERNTPENVVAALVYYRTYARHEGERWYQCVQRVVEGLYQLQRTHVLSQQGEASWDEDAMQEEAQEMYERMFSMKFLPPGRGLWAMGTAIVEEKGLSAALFNCGFISTKDMGVAPTEPFEFLMDASMLGVGVGIDMRGANKRLIFQPSANGPGETFVVADSREGWVQSLKILLETYMYPAQAPVWFDYSEIRPKGTKLKAFGGVSGGAEPLKNLHGQLRQVLDGYAGRRFDTRGIADVCNLIGVAVVSGNIRRSAEILFGDPDDEVFQNLKNYALYPDRESFGWTSNNSIYATIGMDYRKIGDNIRRNGEPGLIWLSNMQEYSRMRHNERDWRDARVCGANPCSEISLEDGELCNLVETFPDKHETLEDYKRTLTCAVTYVKTVTLLASHWPKTSKVMLQNRRLGTSVSGLANFLARRPLTMLKDWLNAGYDHVKCCDEKLSARLGIPRSIKLTTVKPSGSVSLLAGATPGMHYPLATHYIRRVTLSKISPHVAKLSNAGYRVEDSAYDPSSVVVEFPVCVGEGVRCQGDVSMWEQLSLAAFLQEHWSDNQVSATISFHARREGGMIPAALEYFQYRLKGISFLPSTEGSKTYRVSGPLCDSDQRELSDTSEVRPSWVKASYDSNADATQLTFDDSFASETLISDTIQRLRCKGYSVDSRVVTPYPQMPYEPITPEEYTSMIARVRPVDWHGGGGGSTRNSSDTELPESLRFCDGDQCSR